MYACVNASECSAAEAVRRRLTSGPSWPHDRDVCACGRPDGALPTRCGQAARLHSDDLTPTQNLFKQPYIPYRSALDTHSLPTAYANPCSLSAVRPYHARLYRPDAQKCDGAQPSHSVPCSQPAPPYGGKKHRHLVQFSGFSHFPLLHVAGPASCCA